MAAGARIRFTMGEIEKAACRFRLRVREAPEDLCARLDLAWTLFMLSLYRSAAVESADGSVSASHDLFGECVHHLAIVLHLTRESQRSPDVIRLEHLVTLTAGQEALRTAADPARIHANELVRDVRG
jgi:hypothetical protein